MSDTRDGNSSNLLTAGNPTFDANMVIETSGTTLSADNVDLNFGEIEAAAATTETISNGADVTLSVAVPATEDVVFIPNTGVPNILTLDGSPTDFAGTITGFGANDEIILGTNVLPKPFIETIKLSYANGELTVDEQFLGGTVHSTTLAISGAVNNFKATDTSAGIVITDTPCYASGTRILTATGEKLAEDLAVGDTVITVREGGPAMRKIIWTGRRSIDITRHPRPELAWPIRIQAGAFSTGIPARDLRLSPHHAVYADGCLFEAQSLVNGITIVQEQHTRHVTYHHIELEEHDIILAEGLPAESFLDTGNRNMFDHVTAPVVLHPDFRPQGDEGFCVPLVREGAALDALHARLRERAEMLAPATQAA